MSPTNLFRAERLDRAYLPDPHRDEFQDSNSLPMLDASPLLQRVALIFHRFGPYHIARLNCAATQLKIEGVELSHADRTYAWTPTGGLEAFPRHVISADVDAESPRRLLRRTGAVLSALRPDAVAVPGWSHRGALAALLWCNRSRVPAILMSESTALDEVRRRWKEGIKRRILSLFSAALVGGRAHRAYLLELGMGPESVFDGYDVVDNHHFACQADAARQRKAVVRRCLGLPERYFLSSCRFVEKKNLFRLLEAFERYRGGGGLDAWHLVLLGDGPLRPGLLEWVSHRGLREVVHMPGFQQYETLPAYYGLAEAFVHASTTEQWGLVVNEAMAAGLPVLVSDRCGCTADLVVAGVNGYSFDPCDPNELARLMLHVASDRCDRQRLAEAGRVLIADWTPERFARNLRRAVQVALSKPSPRGAADRLLVRAVMLRREKAN